MKKRLKKSRIKRLMIFLVLSACMMICFVGCNRAETGVNSSLVAGQIEVIDDQETDKQIDVSYHVVINEDGSVTAFENTDEMYNFDEWNNIVGISVGGVNAGGIRTDGTVIATGFTEVGATDVGDWRDIATIEFTIFSAYGLRSNGRVVSTGAKHMDEMPDFELAIIKETETWRNMKCIDASCFVVAGVKANGRVVIASIDADYTIQTANWRDVVQVSISDHVLVGLTKRGDVLVAHNAWASTTDLELQDGWEDAEPVKIDYLQGAKKICAGDSFVAGLMSDGIVKICDSGGVFRIADEVLALDGMKNVADINSHADTLVVLSNEGIVTMVGRDD